LATTLVTNTVETKLVGERKRRINSVESLGIVDMDEVTADDGSTNGDAKNVRYEAVLFDNDGVIVERTRDDVVRPAVRDAFRELGVDDPDPHHVEYFHRGPMEDLEPICETYGIDPETFWERRDRLVCDAQKAAIRDGGKPLYDDVGVLDDLPVPCGIVSNNQCDTIDAVVEHYGLEDRFELAHGRDMTVEGVLQKKPDPYYLERALSELGAESALYVGDSAVDVAAAGAAGIDAAFVRRPHRVDYDLPHEPTYEIDGLAELPDLVTSGR
jgi:phosphoglycolate phosphatase-like HAD superfamily hydrolase